MADRIPVPPLPRHLRSKNPLRWLTLFGPGAIMASLTIGTGELIFSSRGGAIFGYRILFLFVVISFFKWVLVYSTARHMVLTGAHPFERWQSLPGPRAWLPAVMFVFAVICFPIWISFHASVLGDLIAGLSGTKTLLNGAIIHVWGAAVLLVVGLLAWSSGYAALERIQLIVVGAMLVAVTVSLILLHPDWSEMLVGALVPQRLTYPDWIFTDRQTLAQQIAETPVWVEASVYVGVIGGASYDYLAYTSFLRNKNWGQSARLYRENQSTAKESSPESLSAAKDWLRAPLVDCTVSFLIVVVFSAVFVASGAIVLGPRHLLPGDGNFLEHQAQFVTHLHPWLLPLYVAGAALAMVGTLYGTLEVAPPLVIEIFHLYRSGRISPPMHTRLRRVAIGWCTLGALAVLVGTFFFQMSSGEDRPPGLTAVLTPASLFTGVLSCGFICLLNPWMDRHLPRAFRPPLILTICNVLAACVFLFVGMRAYWKLGGRNALLILAATVAVGFCASVVIGRVADNRIHENETAT